MEAFGMVAAMRFSTGWRRMKDPVGCAEPEWDALLVFGHRLHRPVYSAEAQAYLFKAGEFEKWMRYTVELAAAIGEKSLMTMQPIESQFVRVAPPEPPPDLSLSVLTMDAVAGVLGLASGRAARAFVKRHGIPHSMVGRQYLVRRESIEEFVKRRERVAPGVAVRTAAVAAGTAGRLGPVQRAVRRHSAEARHAGS